MRSIISLCDECGRECTTGTDLGPPEVDTRGVRRCTECQEDWSQVRNALSPWSRKEAEAVYVGLSQIASDGDPVEPSAEQKQMATDLLARLRNWRFR